MKTTPRIIAAILVALFFSAFTLGDDAALKEAIANHLKDYPPTASINPDIEISDGVVSITGKAENLPSKKLASEVISKVAGVRAIVNRLEIMETDRDDNSIHYHLDRLFSLNYPDHEKAVQFKVNDGVVTLTGAVSTHELFLLSEAMAASVLGVRDVVNLLRVKPLTPPEDDEITQHISLLLKGDPWIEDELVMITVENGVVTLKGAVDSLSEKSRLESAVTVYGVREIKSEDLEVSPELRPRKQRPHEPIFRTDEEILVSLQTALKKDPRVVGSKVEAMVQDKDITLMGSVSSIGAKAAAEADARNVPGAELVYSYLVVESNSNDDAVESAIGALLSADALLAGAEIEAEVESGVATLNGEVLSKYQRRRAVSIAANSSGVQRVVSKLRVDWETPDAYQPEGSE